MRQTGQTTRLIDEAIQQIFKGEKWQAVDHVEGGNHRKANQNLFNRTLQRLSIEHNLSKNELEVDASKLTIKKK